jgi:hypothetical protein
MNAKLTQSKSLRVLAAVALVVVLAGLLGVRIVDWARASGLAARVAAPPPETAPQAHPVNVETLIVPCWGCPGSDEWPVSFRTDLDLLAPLGNGAANAANWFKDFAKPNGSRRADAEAAMARRVDAPGDPRKVLPGNDPLLLEGEPWCDQATMRFDPELFPMKGYETELPNLVLPLTLAKSWVARGRAASDPVKAMEDFRRAIRLGRLLRQEDTTVVQDVVGLACINAGAQGIYDLAVKGGNTELALVAAVVLGEHSAQRLMTAERITKTDIQPNVRKGAAGEVVLDVPDKKLNDIVGVANAGPDRRFRIEAILGLNLVRFLGRQAQQEKAFAALDQLASSNDRIVAEAAVWARDTKPTREYLQGALTLLPPPAPPMKSR